MSEPNLELRRAILEKTGYKQFLDKCTLEHFSDAGKLWKTNNFSEIRGEDKIMKFYQCICPTSKREYIIRVNPEVSMVEEAKLSTFPYLYNIYKKTKIMPEFIYET